MKIYSFFCILFVFSFGFVSSADNSSSTEAAICLEQSFNQISNLNASNFSTQRVLEIYQQADALYRANLVLEEKKSSNVRYDSILNACKEIGRLNDLAFSSQDSFLALIRFYNDSFYGEEINTSLVDSTIASISDEIKSERYEKVQPLIDEAYQEITVIKAENTRGALFYKATSQTLWTVFIKNWKPLTISIAAIILVYLLIRKRIWAQVYKSRLQSLQTRKNNLRELLKKTQKDYFQKGELSQSSYEIRVKNFGEMIRDIDRQIPLLNEEILKLSRRKNETV